MIKGFLLQLQFLTRIPLPENLKFDDKSFSRAIIFAPFIGLIIGVIMAGIYYIFHMLGRDMAAVCFALCAGIMFTGGLHLNGLACFFNDSINKQESSKYIKKTQTGINGTLAIIAVLGLKAVLLISLKIDLLIIYFAAMPVFSRLSMVWAAGLMKNVRNDRNSGKSLVKLIGKKEIIISTFFALIIGYLVLGYLSIAVIASCITLAVIFTKYYVKKTGVNASDMLGANIELSELIVVLVYMAYEIYLERF